MLIVINDGGEPSLKASFVIQHIRLRSNTKVLYVFRKDENRFREKWSHNQIELATSITGILMYFILMMLKSPRDLHDGILRRLSHKGKMPVLTKERFLSALSKALDQYFARSARTDRLMHFLRKLNFPKTFLIDEFSSIAIVNLRKLKDLGSIIYISQDFAWNHFSYADNFIARKLVYKQERNAIVLSDLVIACSEMERLKYLEMGARQAIFYPNIYPIAEFEPCDKDQVPNICIVLPKHWGSKAEMSLNDILRALSCVDRKIRVCVIGMEPQQVPRNVGLQYYERIPRRLDYLRTLSKSWIGINVGIHMGGTNQRKYDYAMAGLVVLSDNLGARGDLLPCEYTYVDNDDLAAKLKQLLEFGKEKITEMGIQNREQAMSTAEKQQERLLRTVNRMARC